MTENEQNKPETKEPIVYKMFGATVGSIVMFFLEVGQIVIIALAIIIPIRYFFIQPFVVKGASMEPNFYENEYLIIDEITYRFREIERGETVVFRPPTGVDQYYIKRVIGLPGETVEINDNKITIYNDEYPNGTLLDEQYITEYTPGHQMVTLGENEYYVMGDNRDESLDSRKFGAIEKNSIVGRVWVRGLPLDRVGTINIPDYSL